MVVTEAGIYLAGEIEASAGNLDFVVGRLAPDGTLLGGSGAIGFDLVANGSDIPYALAAAPGGKLVVAGTVVTPSATHEIGVARLDQATLGLDPTFNGTGKVVLGFGGLDFNDPRLAVLADGSILVGVTFGSLISTDTDLGVFKLLPDGSPDPASASSASRASPSTWAAATATGSAAWRSSPTARSCSPARRSGRTRTSTSPSPASTRAARSTLRSGPTAPARPSSPSISTRPPPTRPWPWRSPPTAASPPSARPPTRRYGARSPC